MGGGSWGLKNYPTWLAARLVPLPPLWGGGVVFNLKPCPQWILYGFFQNWVNNHWGVRRSKQNGNTTQSDDRGTIVGVGTANVQLQVTWRDCTAMGSGGSVANPDLARALDTRDFQRSKKFIWSTNRPSENPLSPSFFDASFFSAKKLSREIKKPKIFWKKLGFKQHGPRATSWIEGI